VRAVDVCAVCYCGLCKSSGCDGGGGVLAAAVSITLPLYLFSLDVRSLPEAAHYSLSVWPSDDQELVEHPTSERNTAPPRAFAPDRCDEVSVSSGVSWKCKTEEHAATVLEGVECDA